MLIHRGELKLKKTVLIIAGYLTGLAITLGTACYAHAEEYRYSVGQGIEFSSGKYGTNTRTSSIYAPFTVIASPTERFGLSLEIPFIYQSNANVVSTLGGGSMQGSRTMMLPVMGMGGMSPSSSGTGTDQSGSGLGDITLKAGYILLPEEDSMPQIRPTVFVKFPTADKNRSLGTGEFDEGFSVEVSKWLGEWNPFAEAGYTLQGKSAQLSLRNYMAYNGGVGYQLSENFRPILLIKGATPPAYGASSLLEVRLKLKYQATKQTGIDGYIARGIATNSPEYGSGLSIFYDF
jgi:hypothetical protein